MSRTISYALTVPPLLSNLVVIGTMGYLASETFQDKIYTDGVGVIGPIIAVTVSTIAALYLAIVIALTLAGITIPALAVILVNSLTLIPAYIVGSVLVGILNEYWGFSGSCYGRKPVSEDSCRRTWHFFNVFHILAIVLLVFGLCVVLFWFYSYFVRVWFSRRVHRVFALIDFVRAIRIRRAERSKKSGL
ncbi:hypothetical protein C8R43DRAFT_1022256 [Mycena crocata]|nr:hypothetical protein C8R43DRAFT_1022256 [Mycena crocata]